MTLPASAWEAAYLRFETPAEERRKFIRRLRGLGVHRWDRQSKVIEVCSGRGNGLSAWRDLGFVHVIGVDLSRALVERSACRPRTLVGDVRTLPVRTSSHDVAVVQGGLHHLASLEDLRHALAEMRRVLKRDGRVIIIEPWMTPFLRGVHLVTEQPFMRRVSTRFDAFATMTDEERPTYEAWLASRHTILEAVMACFEPILIRRRWGKLVFLGRPKPDGAREGVDSVRLRAD
jgi:ubiquinone/menaquinone biosynthesis C-methylase UbiE